MAKKRNAPPKPRNDAYTTMLFITFVSIVIGCVLMALDASEYEGSTPPASPTLTLPKLGSATTTSSGTATPATPAPVVPPDNNP